MALTPYNPRPRMTGAVARPRGALQALRTQAQPMQPVQAVNPMQPVGQAPFSASDTAYGSSNTGYGPIDSMAANPIDLGNMAAGAAQNPGQPIGPSGLMMTGGMPLGPMADQTAKAIGQTIPQMQQAMTAQPMPVGQPVPMGQTTPPAGMQQVGKPMPLTPAAQPISAAPSAPATVARPTGIVNSQVKAL